MALGDRETFLRKLAAPPPARSSAPLPRKVAPAADRERLIAALRAPRSTNGPGWYQPLAAAKPKDEKTAPSGFLGHITGALSGVKDAAAAGWHGLPHLATGVASAAKWLVAPQGASDDGKAIWEGEGSLSDRAARNWEATQTEIRTNAPLLSETGASLQRTAGDVIHPSRFVDAYNKGELTNKLIEDIGNVSIVGGLAGKAVSGTAGMTARSAEAAAAAGNVERAAALTSRAARLDRAGQLVTDVAHLGGETANLPMSLPAKALGKAYQPLGKALTTAAMERPYLARFTPAGREIINAADTGVRSNVEEAGGIITRRGHAVTELNPSLGGVALSEAEQGAVIAAREGSLAQLKHLTEDPEIARKVLERKVAAAEEQITRHGRSTLATRAPDELAKFDAEVASARAALDEYNADPTSDAAIRTMLDEVLYPVGFRAEGNFLTPEAARLGLDVLEGKATPEQIARLAPAKAFLDEEYSRLEADAIAGRGQAKPLARSTDTQDVHQVVADEIRANVSEATHPDLYGQDGTLDWRRVTALSDEQMNKILKRTEDNPFAWANPENWNPEWRRIMRRQQEVAASGASVPTLPPAMRQVGIEPNYVRQVPLGPTMSTVPKGMSSKSTFGRSMRGSEKYREGISSTPHTISGQTRLIVKEAQDAGMNVTFDDVVALGNKPADFLGADTLQALVEEAKAHSDSFGERADAYKPTLGRRILEEADARGLEPWPDGTFTEHTADGPRLTRRSVRLDDTTPIEVGPDTVFFPKGLRNVVAKRFTVQEPPVGLKQLERGNAMFKRAVLPLSVMWHVGDAVFNTLGPVLAKGANPAELARGMLKVRELSKTDAGLAALDQVSTDLGSISFDAHNWLSKLDADAARAEKIAGMGPVRNTARLAVSPIVKAQDLGFKFNGAMNEMQRNAFKVIELEKRLGDLGYTFEDLSKQHVVDIPEVHQAIADVVDSANKAFGTTGLTAFERRMIKPVIPFYQWTKVINTFVARLARDHPARLLWTVQLGQLAADDTDLPDWLAGSFNVGGRYLSMAGANPFNDIITGAPTPRNLLRGTSPFLKIGAAATFGVDASKGLAPLTRPSNTGNLDEYGRPQNTPLISRPGELLGYTLKQFPQTKAAMELLPAMSLGGLDTGAGARYGNGQVLTDRYGNRLDDDRNLAKLIPGLLGIRFPAPDMTVEEVEKMQAAGKARLAKARRLQGD